jgi:hypothetical protein
MRRPMLRECSQDGCCTLTMGELCVEHEPPIRKTFVRGRPYPPRPRSEARRELAHEAA